MNRKLLGKLFYYAAVIGICAGTALGIYFAFIRVPELPPPRAGTQPPGPEAGRADTSKLSVHSPEITHIVDGKVQWQVKAEEVETDPESGASVLRDVQGQVFGDEERVLYFEAPLTFYNPASDTVRIDGTFRGEVGEEKDAALQGRNLQWNNTDRKLLVEQPQLSMNGTRIRSHVLTILPEQDTVEFRGGVEIELDLAGDKPD